MGMFFAILDWRELRVSCNVLYDADFTGISRPVFVTYATSRLHDFPELQ